MNEERTGKRLRQMKYIRGHLWHRYSITVNWWVWTHLTATTPLSCLFFTLSRDALSNSDFHWCQRNSSHGSSLPPAVCWRAHVLVTGPSLSWSCSSWIDNYLCTQCLTPLKLWFRASLRQGILDTTLCVNVWLWLATGRWYSPSTHVSSTNKTVRHDIA